MRLIKITLLLLLLAGWPLAPLLAQGGAKPIVAAAPKGLFLTGTPVLELDGDAGTGTGQQTLCFVDQTNHDMRIGYYTDTYRRTAKGWRLQTRAMTFLRRSGARDSGKAHDPTRPAPSTDATA